MKKQPTDLGALFDVGWPRLSVDLPGRKDPRICQSCCTSAGPITVWQEHDADDQPEAVYVALCAPCGDRLIEPHPRLYAALKRHQPVPGVMEFCLLCRHYGGMRCNSDQALSNGGPGLQIQHPPAGMMFIDGARGPKGGRRTGWQETIYTGPPTDCSGYELPDSLGDDQ